MLIAKGRSCRFDLASGRTVRAPSGAGMLHDPEGTNWPRCSILFASFTRGPVAPDMQRSARSYFGSGYQAGKGKLDAPPKPLEGWTEIGEVKTIWYTRMGNIYGGKPFFHHFKKSMFRGRLPVLYRHGRFMRLELPAGCTVNARGFVSP
jgi:hypothetical protein